MRIPSEIASFKAFSAISKKLSTTYTQYGKSLHKSKANEQSTIPYCNIKGKGFEEKSKKQTTNNTEKTRHRVLLYY